MQINPVSNSHGSFSKIQQKFWVDMVKNTIDINCKVIYNVFMNK